MKKTLLVTRHPNKNYGKPQWGEFCATLLATDYKSPPLVLEIDYGDNQPTEGKDK